MNNKTRRILVVEDDDFIRGLHVRQLARAGYSNVEVAEDGHQAMIKLRGEDFALILLDIEMPVLDGIEVLKLVRADPKLHTIPVIVISGNGEVDKAVKCIELGAEDYLQKPFEPVLLRARIGASLEKKSLRDREASHLAWIREERQKSDDLLDIILPTAVSAELKAHGVATPRRYENVGVLFCDIVGFTAYCEAHEPEVVVSRLQSLIERFELVAEKYQMEKVKTIGDAFMATSGAPRPNADPLVSAVRCGLEMINVTSAVTAGWQVRVGVHSGQVIGGVLGRKKYQFDVWGRAVNIASRMSGYATPGTVAMTYDEWKRLGNGFMGRRRGIWEVKGLGTVEIAECYGLTV